MQSLSPQYEELKKHLREMFQMDRGDFDFGIYRIMNMKRAEVEDFLDNRLLPQVRDILKIYRPAGMDELERELAEAKANPGKFSTDYIEVLKQKLEANIDVSKVEVEIYSHLYNFLTRYYSEGDFISPAPLQERRLCASL